MKSILKAVLILLVPCLISAQIRIKIKPDYENKNRKTGVLTSGYSSVLCADSDLAAFHLRQSKVKENLEAKTEFKRVGDVHIKDAYEFGGFRKLQIALRIKSVKLIRDNHEIKYSKKVVGNKMVYVAYTRTSVKLNETLTTKWFDTQGLSLTSNISHIVGFNGLGDVSVFGKDSFASKVINIGNIEILQDNSGINITKQQWKPKDVVLKPGESVRAKLQVKKATIQVRINYEVSLEGDIYFKYNNCEDFFLDHGCWEDTGLDVNEYFRLIGQSPVLKPYEMVTYTTYFNPQVTLGKKTKKNTDTQNHIREIIFKEKDLHKF